MPSAGTPLASARPRAAAMPMRKPVKAPGPTATAMRSSAAIGTAASLSTASIIGRSCSAWPRAIAAKRRAATRPSRSTAAEQPFPAVSKASTLTTAGAFCAGAAPEPC